MLKIFMILKLHRSVKPTRKCNPQKQAIDIGSLILVFLSDLGYPNLL